MFKNAKIGYDSGNNFISSNPKGFGVIQPHISFFIELLVIGCLTGVGPYISSKVRKDDTNFISVIAVFIIAITLHILLQYAGVIK